MTPQELKNSILQLAIQGKLVEQRPEEGTAAELLEKIAHAETRRRGGKLGGSRSRATGTGEGKGGLKHLPKAAFTLHGTLSALSASPRETIPDDEKPFDIPESWEWVHINQVAETSLGKTMDKEKNTGESCPYLCSINVYWEGISLEKVKEARFTVEDKKKYLLKKGDLLICEGGDVGRSAIWNFDKEMYYQNALHRVRFYDGVLPQYFRLIIECYKGLGIIERYCKGVTIKHLVQNSLYAIWFPLPPLAEQKRIVAKIEELLPLIDRYEKAWSKLENFNRRFPVDMQKSVLQMAIQGKLVDQRPEEGTGEELYRRLKPYHKGLKPCKDELDYSSMDFEIPASWTMIELNQLFDFVDYRGKTPNKTTSGVFLITASNIRQAYMDYTRKEYISREEYKGRQSRGLTQKGDLLFTTEAPMGNAALCDLDECSCGQRIITFKEYTKGTAYPALYMYFILSPQFQQQLLDNCTGTTAKGIKADKLKHFLIPLPPLAEQKRIVAKLEEILPLCERLK